MCHWTLLSSVNAITSYNTPDNAVHFHPLKKYWIWCPNMQKTVFLQSRRTIFKKKIHFWGITECSKHYFSNSGIDHFKTKVAWIHHNIQEILLLPSLHLSPPNIMRENQVVHRSRLGFWYSIPVFADNQCLEYPALQSHSYQK